MVYYVYGVNYIENGKPGFGCMQGVDLLSALKLYSSAYPERFITKIFYKFPISI